MHEELLWSLIPFVELSETAWGMHRAFLCVGQNKKLDMAVTVKDLALYWGKDIRKKLYNLRFNEISEHKEESYQLL